MASLGMHMLGSALSLAGWTGVILSCILPMWRVTAFVGTTIVTAQIMWEGIWMSCVSQSTGHIQCKPYESTLALTSDLMAARILMALSILSGALGLGLAFVGGKCTRFLDDSDSGEMTKARVATAAGAVLMLTGLLCLIPISWSAGVVVQMFYNLQATDAQRREIGAAVYIGWGASILLLLGGGMLCITACHHKIKDDSTSVKYALVHSSQAASSVGSQRVWVIKPAQTGAPSMTSQWSDKKSASLHLGRPSSAGSTYSKALRNSQLPVAKSPDASERSEGPSTKSQLKQAYSDQSLSSSQISESASTKLEKTYI